MGSDKALLTMGNETMAQHVAAQLAAIAQSVCLVGNADKYGHLGFPIIADQILDRGPLSGCEAALLSGAASEWNLIVACDLPCTGTGIFQSLTEAALEAADSTDCIVPRHEGKIEPLCAVYRRRCGFSARLALDHGTRRVVDWVGMLQAEFWPVENMAPFQNVNTPSDWERFLNER